MAFEGIRSRWYARQLGSDADRATFRTLHTASLASPALRAGLNPESVERSLKHLRNLLGTAAVAIADTHRLLGYDGLSTHHADQAAAARRAGRRRDGHRGRRARRPRPARPPAASSQHAIASPLRDRGARGRRPGRAAPTSRRPACCARPRRWPAGSPASSSSPSSTSRGTA